MSLIVIVNGLHDSAESNAALNSRRADLLSTLVSDADVKTFDFFENNIESLDHSYLRKRARGIINSLQQWSAASLRIDSEPAAVVFLAHTIGATLVKQILLLALAHPSYQWLAFGAAGLHFFESPSFTEPGLWDRFLIQTLAIRHACPPTPSQLFSALPNALSKVEEEFAALSAGFKIILHDEPETLNSNGARARLWPFDKDDTSLHEVVHNIRDDFRRKAIGLQMGFQLLQRRLSPPNTSLSRLKAIMTDPESTEWILTDPTYKTWTSSAAPAVLNIAGAPGSGGIYVSSHVISALTKVNEDSKVFILSFDFDRWDSRRNSEQAFFLSLIRQLLTLNPQLYRTVKNITDILVAQSNVALRQLLALFASLMSRMEPHQKVFLVINGADQCLQPLGSRFVSLTSIPSIPASLKILLTTSTPLELPENIPYHEISLSDADVWDSIRSTVKQKVAQIIIQKPAWKDSRKTIVQRLCAEGCTYLQIMLNLSMLERDYMPSTRRGIRQFLSKEVLQPHDILKIAADGLNQGGTARLLLNWVFHALRPLTVTELAAALTLTSDKVEFSVICEEVSSTVVRDLVSSLGTIIKLEDDEVVPIHPTIRAYFEEQRELLVPSFHALATRRCLAYLAACPATVSATRTDVDGFDQPCEETEMATAFLEYTETYWMAHYQLERSPTTDLDGEVNRFLMSGTDAFNRWVGRVEKIFQWLEKDIDTSDALLLAIQLGFRQVVLWKLKHESASIRDRILAALATSARTGNTEIFQDLLETVLPDSDLSPVLCAAAEYGHTEIVRLLIGRTHIPSFSSASKHQESNDPLLLAAVNGHTATVEVLLLNDYPIASPEELVQDGEASSGRTNVIHLAAQLGDVETLLILQRLRADEFRSLIESPNIDGKSPLQLCCITGSSQAFEILFKVSKPNDSELQELLSLAAESGHLAVVDKLLSEGASLVDGTGSPTTGPLQLAAKNGHYAVVCRLMEEGKKLFNNTTENVEATSPSILWKSQLSSSFDVSFNDNDNYDCRIVALLAPHRDNTEGKDENTMVNAVYSGQLDTIKVLMKAGISIHLNQDDSSKYNRLIDVAIAGNHPDTIRFLMDQDIAIQWDQDLSETSIHFATRLGRSLCVRELLRKATHEDVWRKNGNNKTAFELAVEYGSATIVKTFLDSKDGNALFEPRQASQRPRPPKILLTALRSGKLDLINLLLDAGWTANAADSSSQDPSLHVAIEVGDDDITRLLLTRKANPDVKNNKGKTALHIAVQCKSEASIKLLLSYNANPELVDCEGLSPLHVAVKERESSLVAALLGFGVDQFDIEPQIQTERSAENDVSGKEDAKAPHQSSAGVNAEITASGLTPLLMAIENNDFKVVRMLLEAGANPNGPGASWGSLLNAAVYRGQLAIIGALIDSGTNTKTITQSFGGPLHILNFLNCEDRGSSQLRRITNLLLAHGAQLDAGDHGGGTPLMRAIFHGNMEYAEVLLELGANVNTRDDVGMTTMHYAASWGSDELMKKLIGAVSDPCAVDACNRNPLYRAALAAAHDDRSEKFDTILEAIPDGERQSHLESALIASLKAQSTTLFHKIIRVTGLNVNVPDRHGWTALDIASHYKTLSDESEILKSMGATTGSVMEKPARLCACDMYYDNSLSQNGREAWMEGVTHKSSFDFGGAMRADHPIPMDKPTYFEVEIVELVPGNAIAVGLLAETSKLNDPVGMQPGTLGYHNDDRFDIERAEDQPGYEMGQTVGVAVDLSKGKACFVLDNLWRSPPYDVCGQLYPAVSFTSYVVGRSKVRINFGCEMGGTNFKYKPNDDWVDSVATDMQYPSEETQPERTAGEQLVDNE